MKLDRLKYPACVLASLKGVAYTTEVKIHMFAEEYIVFCSDFIFPFFLQHDLKMICKDVLSFIPYFLVKLL